MKGNDIKKWKRVIYPLLFIILTGIIVLNLFTLINGSASNKVVVYRVEAGWGYRILKGQKVAVEQPFIPLLPGRNPFPDRYSAKKTGKLVLNRLEKGIVPVLTFQDLEELGLVN